MEVAAVCALLIFVAFCLSGIVCLIWGLSSTLKIRKEQEKTFSMLSSLLKEMALLKKSLHKTVVSEKIAPIKTDIDIPGVKTPNLTNSKIVAVKKPTVDPTMEAAANAAKLANSTHTKPKPMPKATVPAKYTMPEKSAQPPERVTPTVASTSPQHTETKNQPPPLPAPAVVEKSENAFERKAGEILGQIWNWIVVGEEFRNPDVSMEYAVASVWLLRVAIVILVLAGVFFVNYSIEKGWLGPVARVSGIFVAGLVMLGGGVKMANKKYHPIALGLLGGGLAMLYLGVFAGFAKFKIIDVTTGFALMIIVTIAAGVLSVRLNSLLVAVLGVVGGYMTPMMINSGSGNLPGLYAYMLILGICVLGIAKYRDWKLLNALAFLFTYSLFLVSLDQKYTSADFAMAITFLSLFFMLFSFVPILYNLVNKQKATILELFFMMLNATVFFGKAYGLIIDKYDKRYVAIVTVALALFYIAQIHFFAVRKQRDRNFLIALAGFASFFITFTFPMLLSDAWITTAWAVQALIFMWMSVKMRSNLVRVVAYLLYLLTFARLASHDLSADFLHASSAPYWNAMLDRFMTMGVMILSLAGSFQLLKRERMRDEDSGVYVEAMSSNDIPSPFMDSTVAKIVFWAAFIFLFGYLQFESHAFCGAYYPPLKSTIVSFVWIAAMCYLICRRLELGSGVWRVLTLFMSAYLLKLLFFDLPFWDFSFTRFLYSGDYSYESGLMRLLDFIPSVLFFAYAAFVYRKTLKDERSEVITLDQVFGVSSIIMLFLYTTFELNSFLAWKASGFQSGGISILWSLFAIAFILTGILKRLKVFRYSGLALFLVVVAKVFFSDLSRLDQLYRIIAFLALGLIILAAAFLYVKFKMYFENEKEEEK